MQAVSKTTLTLSGDTSVELLTIVHAPRLSPAYRRVQATLTCRTIDTGLMTVHQMRPDEAARLRAAPLTYAPADLAATGQPPAGYKSFERSTTLTRKDFDAAATDLLSWRMHDRAGLRVSASELTLRKDTVVLMRLGLGPMSLRIPCRVVQVFDEPRMRGFAYGTLPGHPESGEERFVLEARDDGSIQFTVSAFSRPATRIARLGGPISSAAQYRMTSRYLRALDDLS
jgi:uncharacterized protein (UPF0548 family)